MVTLLIGALALLAGVAYWMIAQRAKGQARGAVEPKAARRFGAVEIRLRAGACEAAAALEGQRFLASEAPALPLPACTAAKCTCLFGKLTDRRTEERRFEHGGLGASMFQSANRRAKRERRTTEKPPRT